MTQSPDHPELVYLEAAGYTVGRPDGPPLWIVVHDMEATETVNCAENTALYFHNGAGGRSVSSHYTVDNNSIVQCVLLQNSAWTVGNRPGNNRGINWELCGFASQSRAQWLDAFGVAMFAEMAPIVRSDAARFGIPIQKLTVAEVKAFKKGVTSHNDLRLAFGGTTHTDPGANFPWDVFLEMMRDEAVMTKDEWFLYYRVKGIVTLADPIIIPVNTSVGVNAPVNEPNMLAKKLEQILASSGGGGGGATPGEVAIVVRQALDNSKLSKIA